MIKKIIKLLLPPILSKVWGLLKNKEEVKNITYRGVYNSFHEVIRSFPVTTQYNSHDSLMQTKIKSLEKFKLFSEGKIPSLDFSNSRFNLLSALLAAYSDKGKVSVLDIGGGFGESFIDIKYSCPRLLLEYFVYDLPEVVELSAEFQSQYPDQLRFVRDYSLVQPTFVLFGSSLQYFENYQEVIQEICALNPDLILLTDHPMGVPRTFVCAQVNMKDRVIPRYVFEINEITGLFQKFGYSQILKSVNFYPFHNFDNYDGEHRNCQHYNLAFRRAKGIENIDYITKKK